MTATAPANEVLFDTNDFSPDKLDWDTNNLGPEFAKLRLCYLVNEVISQLRHRIVKRSFPFTFALLHPNENAFVFAISGFSMMNSNDDNPHDQFMYFIKLDTTSTKRNVDQHLVRIDELINKRPMNDDVVTDLALKTYIIRSFKPPQVDSNETIGTKVDSVAKAVFNWLRRQKANQLWNLSMTIKVKHHPVAYLITVKRDGWGNRLRVITLTVTHTTKWVDISKFQHKILRQEMAKQQLHNNGYNDADAAIAVIQPFIEALPPTYKFWCLALHQWHNQTWTKSPFALMDPRRLSQVQKVYLM